MTPTRWPSATFSPTLTYEAICRTRRYAICTIAISMSPRSITVVARSFS
jgi:hypothetical protein